MTKERIYAKSVDSNGNKEPLAEHTLHDIEVGLRLISNLPFGTAKRRRLAKDLVDAITLHDVGKAATGFQKALDGDIKKRWGKRHEILSAVASTELGLSDPAIFAVLTHHKCIPSDGTDMHGCLDWNQIPYQNHITPLWKEMANEFNNNIQLLNVELERIFTKIGHGKLLIKPLISEILSDNLRNWLKRTSQAKQFRYKQREYVSLLRGLVMSADHIASAGNYLPADIPRLSDYPITNYQLYGFQEAAAKTTGNIILRAPTGSGKTEAALLWAQLNQQYNGRLFYALPTTASINAMYLRLGNIFLRDELVGLLHSRSASVLYSLFEGDNPIANQAKARTVASLVREMFYPIRVCTPHQILRYSLQGKGWEAMLSEFPHSVFIFDEIHAYNPKLTGLMMATVRYLVKHNARCMFVTATLPTFLRRLIEQEITGIQFIQPSASIESDRKILEQKRHYLTQLDGNIIDRIDLIVAAADKAESTLIVCNHVPTAQAVYKQLKDRVPATQLLHGRFTRKDRNDKEDSLRSRLPKILVATQVVEVSLDLDFQQCFTEPAAIDALVQRMGRINRKARQQQPAKVYIFTEQLSSADIPYRKELRDKSLQVLTGLPSPLSEEDLNQAADQVYGNGYQGNDLIEYEKGLNYEKLKQFNKYLTAGTNQSWIDEVIDRQEGTKELLLEQLLDDYDRLRSEGFTLEANNLLVPVSNHRLPELFNDNMIIEDKARDLWVLTGCKYDRRIGLEI